MGRKYNHKLYGFVKKINGVVRDKCSPNPTDSLKQFGMKGKFLGSIINHIIAAPIHLLSFFITGIFYDKKKDSPFKGSFLYTIVSILLMFVATGFVANIVQLLR